MNILEGLLYHKIGNVAVPLRIKEPGTEVARLQHIRNELMGIFMHCQGMWDLAGEVRPDTAELDIIQARLDELKTQLPTTTGE
jgi:hypothetical protein